MTISYNQRRFLFVTDMHDTLAFMNNKQGIPVSEFLALFIVDKHAIMEHLLTIKDDEESDEYGNE